MPSTNLIPPLTGFIGRTKELAEIKPLFARARLLTLTGPGGCGKTRLAIQMASQLLTDYLDGVWWVELAALNDPALVPQAIAQVLGLHETPDTSPLETLTHYLRAKHLLLVLDNCEYLLQAYGQMAQALLPHCPSLQILATSREPLGIAGEVTWLVPSLSLPDPTRLPSDLMQYDAICLFIQTAATVLPTFALTPQNAEAVAQICLRLDGMPLAIELAAARVKVLTVEQIAARLDDRFALLTSGNRTALIPRHRTLRAAIDWSYGLLSEKERVLFHRLSVFPGGFALEAAETICSDDGIEQGETLDLLSHLVDKSLVIARTQGPAEARYQLLETIRQYGFEKLRASGEEIKVRRRHREWFLRMVEQAEVEWHGPKQAAWIERLETEHDNFRAALDWSARAADGREAGLRLAVALWAFWFVRGHYSEGRERLVELLSQPAQAEPGAAVLRAKALNCVGALMWYQGNHVEARPPVEEALALDTKFNNRGGIAASLRYLGLISISQGDDEAARSFLEQSLVMFRELDLKWQIASCLMALGDIALSESSHDQAHALYEESVLLLREIRDKDLLAYPLRRLAYLARRQGDWRTTTALCQESLTLNLDLGDKRGVAACLAGLGAVAAAQRHTDEAMRLFGAAKALLNAIGAQLMDADRSEYERNLMPLRAQLGEAAFERAWAEGLELTLDQAIKQAMSLASQLEKETERVQRLVEPLNARELEVLGLFAKGLSNHEIADQLALAVSTVKWYINSLFSKLGVHSRTQAVARARELGLL